MSSLVLSQEDIKNLREFKDSLESSIEYIDIIFEGVRTKTDLSDCDEIGYLFRDFVGEKALFSHGRYPTNEKLYEALEDMNNRYEKSQEEVYV